MMDAIEPVMEPIRTEDEVSQNAQSVLWLSRRTEAISRMECAMLMERFQNGEISAFRYQPVAIRPTDTDGDFDVFFCQQQSAQIILHIHDA
jgi:hypothetical protein